MANHYDDNADLRFYVEQAIDWEPLVRLSEYNWQSKEGFSSSEEALEFFTEIFSLIGEFAGNEIAPRWQELDTQPPTLVDGEVVIPEVQQQIFDQIREMELHGLCLPRELGGSNCPLLVMQMAHELFARADVSVCAHHGFHGGSALAMLAYSLDEGSTTFDRERGCISSTRFSDGIRDILSGAAWGSMDITEPDAGSDMAALRCTAHQDGDGVWRLNGQKIYITSGHAKYHFVIARTEDADESVLGGLKGLSMFLAKAYDEDEDGNRVRYAMLDGIEKKLGHNASATVSISFEDTPAELLGERGDGFRQMLLLMNNARVAVGFEALGICEAAYRMAKSYAEERPSMGKTIDRHEMIADYLEEMWTDIQAIRALAIHAGWHEEIAQKTKLMLRYFPPEGATEREAMEASLAHHKRVARSCTPLLKYYASERAVDMARRCVQIHGGGGYTKDYGAEKLLRDAMVLPIYEGTSQIQALMAMKDTLLGVVRAPQTFFADMTRNRVTAMTARSRQVRAVASLRGIQYRVVRHLMTRLAGAKISSLRGQPMNDWSKALTGWDPKKDFSFAMLHAERLTQILTDVKMAEVLLDQAQSYPERAELLDRWLERALPRCRYRAEQITTTGDRLLERLNPPADAPPQIEQAQAAK